MSHTNVFQVHQIRNLAVRNDFRQLILIWLRFNLDFLWILKNIINTIAKTISSGKLQFAKVSIPQSPESFSKVSFSIPVNL